MGTTFGRWPAAIASWTGHRSAFFLATLAGVVWAVSGPLVGFSATWQRVVNTATTAPTFLAVSVIEHARNRDARAVRPKLDEIIRAPGGAR